MDDKKLFEIVWKFEIEIVFDFYKLLLKVKMLQNASYFESKCDLIKHTGSKIRKKQVLCDKHLHIAYRPEYWVDTVPVSWKVA